MKSGNTYSRALGTTIGSESLTTVFGMGTGVAFPKSSPERSRRRRSRRRLLGGCALSGSGQASLSMGREPADGRTAIARLPSLVCSYEERWIHVAKHSPVSIG
jgi:hypothetical protein